MERHAGLLVRLSNAKQTDEATDDATERQEERSRAFCMAKGWPVVRVYRDVDVSAYRAPYQKAPPRREGFEQALVDIQSGVIDALVCTGLIDFAATTATSSGYWPPASDIAPWSSA